MFCGFSFPTHMLRKEIFGVAIRRQHAGDRDELETVVTSVKT